MNKATASVVLTIAIALLAGGAAVAGLPVAAPRLSACYSAQFTALPPRTLTLTDAVAGMVSVRIDYADTLCTSAPGGTSDYLACFHVAKTSAGRTTLIKASSPLWTLIITRAVPTSVCLAAAHADRGAVPLPTSATSSYLCYPAARSSISTATSSGVAVKDAFAGSTDKLLQPTRVCAPASKSATISKTAVYLACYSVQSTSSGVITSIRTSEFGLMRAGAGQRDELCADATRS